ncbi:hypothetical protein BH23BAC3_BH23BAC3_23420 [soil metagenome]
MKTKIYISILTAFFLTSCFDYNQDSYEEQYVVEAYLFAGRELPDILLSTTVPADETYDYENSKVYNAQVEVRLLTSGLFSEVEQTFNYTV